jgi:hypothetical protein
MTIVVAVLRIFVVRWFLPLLSIDSLPCAIFNRCRAALFGVRLFFAVHFPGRTRQRYLYRAGAHGKEWLHGGAYFSGSKVFYKCFIFLLTLGKTWHCLVSDARHLQREKDIATMRCRTDHVKPQVMEYL